MEEKRIKIVCVGSDKEVTEMTEELLNFESDFDALSVADASLIFEMARKGEVECIVIETACAYAGFSLYKGKRVGDIYRHKVGMQAILDMKEKYPELKVIAVTTWSESNFIDYLEEISDGVVKEPFFMEELVQRIREVCVVAMQK